MTIPEMPYLSPNLGSKESSSPPTLAVLLPLHSLVLEKVKCLLNTTLEQRKEHQEALAHVPSQGCGKSMMLPHSSDVLSMVLCASIHGSSSPTDISGVFHQDSGHSLRYFASSLAWYPRRRQPKSTEVWDLSIQTGYFVSRVHHCSHQLPPTSLSFPHMTLLMLRC